MDNLGIELEADPRHAEIVVRELGLEDATPSKVPGAKVDGNTDMPMRKDVEKIASIQQNNIDAESASTIRKNRQKAFGMCIWEGIWPNEAEAWTDGLSTEGGQIPFVLHVQCFDATIIWTEREYTGNATQMEFVQTC